MLSSALAVAVGSGAGAILRWQLSVRLNASGAVISWGTLLANAIGAYIIGLAMAWLTTRPELSPEWRLLIITGFCGGLTTFSTFSAEVLTLLQTGRPVAALVATASHVTVSLVLTWLGLNSISFTSKI